MKALLAVACVIAFLVLSVRISFSQDIELGREEPLAIITTEFVGTPQFPEPVVLSSGTLTLTMHLQNATFENIDDGQMAFMTEDRQKFKIGNQWTEMAPQTYRWSQYITPNIQKVYIDSPTIRMEWHGYGPYIAYIGGGLWKTTGSTKVEFEVSGPIYRDYSGEYDPTWDWYFDATPFWAWQQWTNWSRLTMEIVTSCNWYGDNHEGQFKWSGISPDVVFGNGVYREKLLYPLVDVPWVLTSDNGDLIAEGMTEGPSCWRSRQFLPVVQ